MIQKGLIENHIKGVRPNRRRSGREQALKGVNAVETIDPNPMNGVAQLNRQFVWRKAALIGRKVDAYGMGSLSSSAGVQQKQEEDETWFEHGGGGFEWRFAQMQITRSRLARDLKVGC